MAASAWEFYDSFKDKLGSGLIDLSSDVFRIALYQSASNCTLKTLSIKSSITNEVASVANAYAIGGLTLSAVTWGAGVSAGVRRFDSTAKIFTASTANIVNIRFAVIFDNSLGGSLEARPCVCFAALTTAQFTLNTGNTLTITPNNPNGIFELT